MTHPEAQPRTDGQAPDGKASARGGWCLLLVLVGTGIIVSAPIFLSLMRFSVIPPYPALVRPAGIVEGTVEAGGSEERSVRVEMTLPDAAREAAAIGDDTVYIELDLIDPRPQRPVQLTVFRRDHPGVVLRDIEIQPGADARWTLVCDPDADACRATYEIVFAPDGSSAPVTIGWRLIAEVRPPRGAEVEEGAAIQLREVPDR